VVTLQGETVMDDNDIYSHSVSLRTGLRLGLRTAAAVTGCSQFTLDDAVRRFGLSASAGTVVPNGVEFEAKEQETALDIPFRRFVLALGRAVDKKGFDLLIDAYHVLAGCNPETGLVIGGDGPALPGLLRRVHQYGLADRVVLPGSLSRGQVTWAMRNAEVFVLPSRIEPFGIVVLEAMSEGVPVIVSPHGGATEIVRDGIDGFVVDPFDSKALATTLGRILQEPRERVRLAEAGRARVQAYDWKAITERYLAIYRWAISEPHRASNQ
jgi:glycosyltransferase involved in cell wall biosynthesis